MEEANAALMDQVRALAETVDGLNQRLDSAVHRPPGRSPAPTRCRIRRPTSPTSPRSRPTRRRAARGPWEGPPKCRRSPPARSRSARRARRGSGPARRPTSPTCRSSRPTRPRRSPADRPERAGARAGRPRPVRLPGRLRQDGFVIRPIDEEKTPFELRINGRVQFRYENFTANERDWIDRTGTLLPILSRSNFAIPRRRLDFRGFAIDPKLQYRFTFNGTTNDANVATLVYYWVNYEFSEAFNLHFGRNFVPGSRYWSNGSSRLQFAGRPLATSFFRPGRSVGVWATGVPRPACSTGSRSPTPSAPTRSPTQIDRNFVYSGTGWYDLFDNYGDGYSDLEWHEDLALRIGNSLTFTHDDGDRAGRGPLAEENAIRLTDGTPLDSTGALAPGVTVDQFDLYLYAIDAGLKYRGFSLNGEYYMRWLQGIRGSAARCRSPSIFDHGLRRAGRLLPHPRACWS